MQALRSHFAKLGYVLVPNVIPSADADALRTNLINACVARRKHLIDLPLIDTIVKQTSRVADPLYDKLEKRLQQHRRRIKFLKAKKRRAQGKSTYDSISGDDVWAMSQKIAQAMVAGNSAGNSDRHNPIVEATVETDHQMLAAINKHQANAWMTNPKVEAAVRSPNLGKAVGSLVQDIVGDSGSQGPKVATMKHPFLFADLPIYREPYSRSVAPTFMAPYMGINSTALPPSAACAAWVFTSDHSTLRMPIHIFDQSHTYIRAQYWRDVEPLQFEVKFKPMESHTPHWLRRFRFSSDLSVTTLSDIPKGSVLLCDPHLLVGSGCNYSSSPTAIMRMAVLDGDICGPSLKAPSWTRDWRSAPSDVPFMSDVVFPRLY
eukprot:GILI01027105.1.p1 GENE.GILI01027105.1~~GILI01027105.1.p1  ORF type:complete len:375 (+),score=39.23 GILI01027105.1:63-1187(+)